MRSKFLTRQGNIVSLDGLFAPSRSRRAYGSSASQNISPDTPYSDARDDLGEPGNMGTRVRRSGRYSGNIEFDQVIGPRPTGRGLRFDDPLPEFDDAPSSNRAQRERQRRQSGSSARERGFTAFAGNRTADRDQWQPSPNGERAQSESAGERRRRERASARADRMFERQYANEATASAPEEGAPRAALYEGRTGSSQRRAVRMQKASEAGPVSAKINPAGWLTNLNVSKRSLRCATAVLCAVLICLFLYTPAQQYYQATREHDRLAAEYAFIEQRNDAIDAQNVALASNAGMEDAVRQKYGYVVQGDETAVVTGLSDSAANGHASDNVEANVLGSAVKAPEAWYTPYLDAFFGVS